MKTGKLILISGPSGVGKGTIREAIVKQKGEFFKFSVSATTRKKRDGEVEGRDYYFMDTDHFRELVESGGMLEYAEFAGNMYGTPKQAVVNELNSGHNVLLEIECIGARQVMSQMNNIISIFIMPPSIEELEQRLVNRNTESHDQINKRLMKAESEIFDSKLYKYNVINDNVEQAAQEIINIFSNEGII